MPCRPRSAGHGLTPCGLAERIAGSPRMAVSRARCGWHIGADGLRFRLTDMAMHLVPDAAKGLSGLPASKGWPADDLSVCSFHTGVDRIIRNVADDLSLAPHQVQPAAEALKSGNTMAVAMGTGFGPGSGSSAFLWTFHAPGTWTAGR